MKINAATIEEFFGASGVQASDLRTIDHLRVETAPELKRQLFAGPSITLLGYGEMTWANQSASGVWPFISLAPQKVAFLWQPFIKTASAKRRTARIASVSKSSPLSQRRSYAMPSETR